MICFEQVGHVVRRMYIFETCKGISSSTIDFYNERTDTISTGKISLQRFDKFKFRAQFKVALLHEIFGAQHSLIFF